MKISRLFAALFLLVSTLFLGMLAKTRTKESIPDLPFDWAGY